MRTYSIGLDVASSKGEEEPNGNPVYCWWTERLELGESVPNPGPSGLDRRFSNPNRLRL